MQILLQTLGTNTLINLVNGVPNLSAYSEPTLSILQAAFDAGNYEIIPDPEPVIGQTIPNWNGFNAYMLTDQTFKGYRDIVRPIDGDLNGALFDAYGLVASNGVESFSLLWNVWSQISGITPEDKEVIAMTAEYFNLPADFIAVIRG